MTVRRRTDRPIVPGRYAAVAAALLAAGLAVAQPPTTAPTTTAPTTTAPTTTTTTTTTVVVNQPVRPAVASPAVTASIHDLAAKIRKMNADQTTVDATPKVAAFDLSTPVVEKPADFSLLGGGGDADALTLRGLVERLHKARDDKDVRAVLMTLNAPGTNLSQSQEFRDALIECRKAGKKTFVYADGYDTDSYTIASGATNVCLLPAGGDDDPRRRHPDDVPQGPVRQARRPGRLRADRGLQGGRRGVHPHGPQQGVRGRAEQADGRVVRPGDHRHRHQPEPAGVGREGGRRPVDHDGRRRQAPRVRRPPG